MVVILIKSRRDEVRRLFILPRHRHDYFLKWFWSGCVSVYPTQPGNLNGLIKLEVRKWRRMHTMFWKNGKLLLFWKRYHWAYRVFSASCIVHVGTLLSFPKLIPLLIYVGMPWGDGGIDGLGTSCWHPLLRAFYVLLSYCSSFMYNG